MMKHKLYGMGAVAVSGVLAYGLISPAAISATVPGINVGISVSTGGGNPDNLAMKPSSSQDGRYIAYVSAATNLVSSDTNGQTDIFVRDRLNGTTTMLSVSSSGVQANGPSNRAQISANGRYVTFESTATNLVSGDTNAKSDIFVRDQVLNTTQLVSSSSAGVIGNDYSGEPDISADGKHVVFNSYATNLVSSPSITYNGVYVKNLSSGEVKLVSKSASGVAPNALINTPSISCEGRFIIFSSGANNLVSGDPNYPLVKNKQRIYLVDMLNGGTLDYLTGTADKSMSPGQISCNGNYIPLVSAASNIVSGDTNLVNDTFLYDRINSSFERISISSTGTEGNGANYGESMSVSNDGKFVTFASTATNMVSGDTNGKVDVFLRNRQAGTTEVISMNASSVLGDGDSLDAAISYDGRYVSYTSAATNLVSGYGTTANAVYSSQTGAGNDY
jgi:hypothetical protein